MIGCCHGQDIPWRAASADNMLPVILSYLNKDMRPEIPAGTPKALAELINDCWHPVSLGLSAWAVKLWSGSAV